MLLCPETFDKSVNEIVHPKIDLLGFLDQDDTVSSVTSVSQDSVKPSTADALSPTGGQVNSVVLHINGRTVEPGEGVQFIVPAGGTLGAVYVFSVIYVDGGGQTREIGVRVRIV